MIKVLKTRDQFVESICTLKYNKGLDSRLSVLKDWIAT